MKFKNINPVEKHFEKALVALAAVTAAYFVYANLIQDPVVVGPGITPDKVENVISDALAGYHLAVEHQPALNVRPTDFVAQYARIIKEPLDPRLLTGVATVGPEQLPITLGTIHDGTPPTPTLAVPAVPPLIEPQIETGRIVAVMAAPDPKATAPVRGDVRDVTFVQGKATLQAGALRANVEKIPVADLRQTAIYRIHVQRQERLAGAWPGPSEWTDLPPLPIDPLPVFVTQGVKDKELPDKIAAIRSHVHEIIDPAFYAPAGARPIEAPAPNLAPGTGQPGGQTRPPRPGVAPHVAPPSGAHNAVTEARLRREAEAAARAAEAAVAPVAGPVAPPAAGPAPGANEAGVAEGGGLLGLGDAETVPVWFWDDQVKAEHTYRYQARVEIINPLYHLPKPLLTNPPAARAQVWLVSDWLGFNPVTLEADEYFYLSANNLDTHEGLAAYFKIYKWYQGSWVAVEDRVEIGSILGGKRLVPQRLGQPAISMDFSTSYTVVDIRSVSVAAGQDVQVVLLNNITGQLVLRNLLNDSRDAQRLRLEQAVGRKPGAS